MSEVDTLLGADVEGFIEAVRPDLDVFPRLTARQNSWNRTVDPFG